MQTKLRWIARDSTSCLHATAAMLRGQAVADVELSETLAEPVRQLESELEKAGLTHPSLLAHLIPLSADIDNLHQLAKTAVLKTAGPRDQVESIVAGIVRALRELEHAFSQCRPKVTEQLKLRSHVFREQWDTRGHGLLLSVARLTEEGLVPTRADVVLLHPFIGGGGEPYLPYNCVTIEAMLANPHADLPEIVRLGWLISQLNLEVPLISETVHGSRLQTIGPLSMLPAALTAGEEVELCRYDEQTLRRALECWQLEVEDVDATAKELDLWWQTYREAKPKWPVALAALDQMLSPKK